MTLSNETTKLGALALTMLLAVGALSVFGGGIVGAESSIEAGNNSNSHLSMTVHDDSTESSFDYAITVENVGSNATDISDLTWTTDGASTYASPTVNRTLQPGETVTIHTADGSSSTSDVYLNWSTPASMTGEFSVSYEVDGDSANWSLSALYNIDSDGDSLPDNLDPYPEIAPTTNEFTKNDSQGTNATLYVDLENSTGTADVSLYRVNSTSGDTIELHNESIDTSNGSVTVSTDISGLADNTSVIIQSHGPANVTDSGIAYDTDSTTTTTTTTTSSTDGGGSGFADDNQLPLVFGGLAVVLILLAAVGRIAS